jgi:hypothetical protein
VEVIGDDGDVDGQLLTVVIGTGGDDVHAVDAIHLRPATTQIEKPIIVGSDSNGACRSKRDHGDYTY